MHKKTKAEKREKKKRLKTKKKVSGKSVFVLQEIIKEKSKEMNEKNKERKEANKKTP